MRHIFTSTGSKLVHHPDVVRKVKEEQKASPISLQVGPTSRCNLDCSFCSNAKREKHEDLERDELMEVLADLRSKGLKTVEWTGGGDPTMYEHINFIMGFSHTLNLEQGMITNGILLGQKIFPQNLNRLKWLRISMNCLDYFSHVELPPIKGVLGFSYVMNDKTDTHVMEKLDRMVKRYQPRYVRVVPDCLSSHEQQEENNRLYGNLVKGWGRPYFYQDKHFNTCTKCYWCYFKPFLLHDGYVYPCSSVVLNSGSDGKFHKKFRWVKMGDLVEVYDKEMSPLFTDDCDKCVFKGQNDLIESILDIGGMGNFV